MLQCCAGGKIEKNEMGGACGAYEGGERCAQGSGFYCKTYCLLNAFRAPLCPSSGALELYIWLLPVVLGSVKMENVIYRLGSISVL